MKRVLKYLGVEIVKMFLDFEKSNRVLRLGLWFCKKKIRYLELKKCSTIVDLEM